MHITTKLHSAKYYTIMADETTDADNKEQLDVVFCYIHDELQAYEEFVGLYQLDKTDAKSIVATLKDVMVGMNLDIHHLRRQCYDGVSTMSGVRTGVAKQILEEESCAFYIQCFGHVLYLAAGGTIRKVLELKNALDITHKMSKLFSEACCNFPHAERTSTRHARFP